MKTKIIYISGNEVFEMSEIRAAFDSVRAALGLDKDTILFGVPVDADNALSGVDDVAPVAEPVVATANKPEIEPIVEPVIEPVIEPIVESVVEPVAETEYAPVAEIVPEQIVDVAPETPETPETPESPASEPVIPILSILSAQETPVEPVVETVIKPVVEPVAEVVVEPVAEVVVEPVAEVVAEPVMESVVEVITEPVADVVETAIISDINVDSELSAPVVAADDAVETVTIGDMITDDAPVPQMEKTLEELLETMAPLREDVQTTPVAEVPADIFEGDDTDATLAQLATEFADAQDKIPAAPRATGAGKIGKLKNILPFKKAKRDDSGLMGDLFGWAGIAANDEDFSIPGFFTPAASKKQGA